LSYSSLSSSLPTGTQLVHAQVCRLACSGRPGDHPACSASPPPPASRAPPALPHLRRPPPHLLRSASPPAPAAPLTSPDRPPRAQAHCGGGAWSKSTCRRFDQPNPRRRRGSGGRERADEHPRGERNPFLRLRRRPFIRSRRQRYQTRSRRREGQGVETERGTRALPKSWCGKTTGEGGKAGGRKIASEPRSTYMASGGCRARYTGEEDSEAVGTVLL
jgi:hypothetical protein